MENMRFKVGDRVKVKSLQWFNENSDDDYNVVFANGWHFSEPMSIFCGKELIIEKLSYSTNPPHYVMEDNIFAWTDEMIECKVEEEIREVTDKYYWEMLGGKSTKEFNLPDGYIFKDEDGNVINATKIVLEKKKKEYPKTYEECCKVLGYSGNYNMILTTDVDNKIFNALYRLKVCRDAYWKLYGEEMGLGKPWKPNDSSGYCTYAILRHTGHIRKSRPCADSVLLEFPTEEMRDAFKENFDPDIEICKELL